MLSRVGIAGFAGASVILAANVHVTAENGVPQLRGVGGTRRIADQPVQLARYIKLAETHYA